MQEALFNADQPKTVPSWVYVIGGEHSSVVKIGKADDVDKRLRGIQTSNPHRLVVRWKTPGNEKLEHQLHAKFERIRLEGEWFDFGDQDPVVAIRAAVESLTGNAAPIDAVKPEAFVEPERDIRWAALDDPDRDDPEHQPHGCGCRQLTPTELAAKGEAPDAEYVMYTGCPLPGGKPCLGAH